MRDNISRSVLLIKIIRKVGIRICPIMLSFAVISIFIFRKIPAQNVY